MKRSEMIEIITAYINNKVQHRDDYLLGKFHATRLLNLIEEHGITPPIREVYYRSQDFPPPATKNLRREMDYSWEPEE